MIAGLGVEKVDEGVDFFRLQRLLGQLLQVLIIAGLPHDRQLVPLGKPAVKCERDGQDLAVTRIMGAFAK